MPDAPKIFEMHRPVENPVDDRWKTQASPQSKGEREKVKGAQLNLLIHIKTYKPRCSEKERSTLYVIRYTIHIQREKLKCYNTLSPFNFQLAKRRARG